MNVENLVVGKLLKEKLMANGNHATFPMVRTETSIYFYSFDLGIMYEKIGSAIFPFDLFDAVVKEANRLGGKMYCADSAARNGERLGSENLPLTVIDAFVAHEAFGKEEGDTILGCATYIASTLRWLGVVDYEKDSLGRYIKVKPEYSHIK